MTKQLFSSLNKTAKNNKLLLLIVIIFLLLNNLPYLVGVYKTFGSNQVYNGSSIFNNNDHFVYISMIEMGRQDHLIMKNPYNYEDHKPIWLSPQWYIIGQFSKYTSIDTTMSFHLFRIGATLIFLYILWWWVKKILTEHKKRIWALVAILLSSGFGLIYTACCPKSSLRPTDFNTVEANTFLNLAHSPVFIISQALLLAIFGLFIQKKYWLVAILTFYLSLIHPYDAISIVCMTTIWTIIKAKNNLKILPNLIYVYTPIIPAATYYYLIFNLNHAAKQWQLQNITLSGSILNYIIGFGIFSILFIIGLWLVIKNKLYKNEYILFLAIWAIAGWVMVYLPIDVNRRLSNGWHIPIVILSILAIFWIYQKIKSIILKHIFVSLLIILGCFGTMATTVIMSKNIYKNNNGYYFNTKEALKIYKFIKNTANQNFIVMTRGRLGTILPAYTGLTVYIGHDHQTWDIKSKTKEVVDLWSSQKDIGSWLKAKNVGYIFAQRKYIPEFDYIKWLSQESYIEPIIDNDDFIFYKVLNPQ